MSVLRGDQAIPLLPVVVLYCPTPPRLCYDSVEFAVLETWLLAVDAFAAAAVAPIKLWFSVPFLAVVVMAKDLAWCATIPLLVEEPCRVFALFLVELLDTLE